MKKILRGLGYILFLVFFVLIVRLAGDIDNSYIVDCTVTSNKNSEIVIKDWQDRLWVYDADDVNIHEGDTVKVKFHTNFSEHNRNDDTIVWIKEDN